MNFQERLKELRLDKHLSQTELAKILEVSQSAITKWECGRTEPTASALIKLSGYFGVSTDFLLGLKDL